MSESKIAIIIGAGPAGLTAAFELLKQTSVKPIVIEASHAIGGLSQTIDYKGNKIDIGGHRFFSKSDKVMDWWLSILPILETDNTIHLSYQNKYTSVEPKLINNPTIDEVMLVRKRISRILFNRSLLDYPLKLSYELLKSLGYWKVSKIGFSYFKARLFPIKDEKTLEDFFINRFGRELYEIFFKDYTEKVWGQACNEIDASWGKQRIKGLSVSKAISHALKLKSKSTDILQKELETSLIEKFLYPKYGPGQMWQEVAKWIEANGGTIIKGHKIIGLHRQANTIDKVTLYNASFNENIELNADYVISTMPVKELIQAITPTVPLDVLKVAQELIYRDFMTVGVLLNRVSDYKGNTLPDNWIYIQERDVKVGRLQIFNNWSPYMVKDPTRIWVGLEYFVNEGDDLWNLSDSSMSELALNELIKLGLTRKEDYLDSTVIRMKKAYPSYTGSYYEFNTIRNYTDAIENLFLIGRNGMHRYNNQDHSMLTAMAAVENIKNGITSKDAIWEVNTEQEYHEEKSSNK